jgi:hypothetical protein
MSNSHPYLLAEWDEMKKFYRGPYIDAFCQVWFHLAKLFQRSRLKYEKVNGRTPSDSNTSPPRAILVSDWLMLKKSSPLKLLGQMEPNLAGSIYVRSSIKLLRGNQIYFKIAGHVDLDMLHMFAA